VFSITPPVNLQSVTVSVAVYCPSLDALGWVLEPGVKLDGAYYCNIVLSEQLLCAICHRWLLHCLAGHLSAPHWHTVHVEPLSCCSTRRQNSSHMWPPNNPGLSPVDYIVPVCLSENQRGTSMSKSSIWLKHDQESTECHWSSVQWRVRLNACLRTKGKH